MHNVLERPQPQTIPQSASISESTHTLMYRGTTYSGPAHQPLNRIPEEVAQLMGKRLVYRSVTYEIVPASSPVSPVPKAPRQLSYRGVSYVSNPQPSQRHFDYAVI
jgi:hypothetical protein